MSLKYVDELSLAENIVKTKEHVESVRAALDSAKQNKMQFSTMPTASEDYLGAVVIYTGATTNTYTHGYTYECVSDGEVTPTYSWQPQPVQDSVSVDGTTIVKDSQTDQISAVTATQNTLGVVKGGDGISINANGGVDVIDRLVVTDTMPTASVSLLSETRLFIGTTGTYEKGGIYQCQLVPESDPAEYEWVLISTAGVDLSQYKKIFSGTSAEWDALPLEDKITYDYIMPDDDGETGDIADVVQSGNHNPVESDAVFDSEQKLYKIDAAYGVKNLAPRLNSQTINNVTFDVNDDGSVTVNGTATSDCWYNICGQDINNFLQAGENYIASGCPEGGSDTTFFMYIGGSYLKYVLDDTSFTCDAAKSGNFYICVRTNTVMDNVVFYPMIRLASYVDNTYEPYAKTNQQLTEDKAEQAEVNDIVNVLGAKNILKNKVTTTDNWHGVSRTVNADFTITLNGTSTAWDFANFNYVKGQKSIPSGTYIISGGCENTALAVVADGSVIARQYGSGETVFTITDNMLETYARFEMSTDKTFTSENSIIKPMIRSVSIQDSTYEPYAKTNQQLTKETTGLIDNQNVNGAVNMLPITATTQVINGITWTVNDDGTVTAEAGTATESGSQLVLTGALQLETGKRYRVTGCPSGGATSGAYYIAIYQSGVIDKSDIGDGYEFTATAEMTNVKIYAIISGNVTITAKTFKPMLSLASLNLGYGDYVPYAKSNKELTEIVDPLKTQFDADHNIVKTIYTTLNTYWTGNALPSDFSNLTTQQATDIAQALYDVFKKIGGAGGIRYTGLAKQYHRKASDGSELGSSTLMVDIYSNASYDSMLSNNANARFTLVYHPYGSSIQTTYALWGSKLMCSSHGINAIGTLADYDKLYTYNTISTYKG